MSELKDNGVMAGQDSSDTSDSEEMIDAEAEQEESAESAEDQSPIEHGESPIEAHLSDNEEAYTELPPESTIDGNTNANENDPEKSKNDGGDERSPENDLEAAGPSEGVPEIKFEDANGEELDNEENVEGGPQTRKENGVKVQASPKQEVAVAEYPVNTEATNQSFRVETQMVEGDESGTEEEQAAFMKELENFFKERSLEFKAPKFYGEGLNCLKLWRAVTKLGGYDQVTSCKLWRQVGESFKPPKTCTTVSWSFRCFYEKALLEYERHKMRGGELPVPVASITEPMSAERQSDKQASGSGRARRDAAARAMQGWHSQRLLGNGEVGDPIIKDKNAVSVPKRDKHLKSVGLLKRKKPSTLDRAVKAARTITKAAKPQMDTVVADIGPSADWVKVNVRKTKDCFEVYALVPGLLREEVRVQSDPAGRLVISGDPEQPDNPWGVTPFKKVISLPSRIDPHQTSAVVTLHGQLFVRVPFEQSDL
ncbi:ARID/BRIGHT DNA-binding domain [Macleaya cordata]|uniref:ARID/BRIGHT DNA-binding domain n=1 Tax=Macleaya cordata TaxID=56857 RepID=A0A200PS47_MACCD|nr:ARID/BRIGHT DNA-binding domain [Macleaya cordata]